MSRRLIDGTRPVPGPDANKGGRPKNTPDILTLELSKKICDILRMGAHLDTAARAHGISVDSIRNWVIKGKEDPKSLYAAFYQSMQRALAEAEIRDLAGIDKVARGHAAEYLMEPVYDDHGVQILEAMTAPDGSVMYDEQGRIKQKPLMRKALDGEGRPIRIRSETKASWQAIAWKMERRYAGKWAKVEHLHVTEEIMNAEKDVTPKQEDTISPEQYRKELKEFVQLAQALKNLEDDPHSKLDYDVEDEDEE